MAASSNARLADSNWTCPASVRLKKPQALPTGRPAALHGAFGLVFVRLLWEKILARVERACPGASSAAGPPHTSSPAGRCDLNFMFFRIRRCHVRKFMRPKLRGSRPSRALCKTSAAHHASQTTAQITIRCANASQRHNRHSAIAALTKPQLQKTQLTALSSTSCLSATPLF